MAPPISTYQTENFDPPPDEELICSICRCVFYDPVECPCRHVYCRTCISNWLNRHKTCPVCRKRASVTTLQTVVPLIKNMIMKLTINCPNVERGCKQKMPLEAKASHLMSCEYEMIQCRNTNCKEKFVRKDIAKHEQKECKCRKVRCHRKCMLMIPFNMIKTHSCVEELKKELKEKKSVIEDLKKEVEQYKTELKKIKNELQQAVNRNSVRDFSDDLGSLHSDGSFSSSLSTVDFTDSDSNLSNLPSIISFNSEEHDVDSDVEEPEVRSFIDLILMALFPSSDETVEHQNTEVITAPGSDNLMSNNDATREISSLALLQEEANERQRSQATINNCEQLSSATVRNNSMGEATTSRNVSLPNSNSKTLEPLQEQECENSDVSSGEITPSERCGNQSDDDDNTLALRSRMLKRKSPVPVLSDSSESEPQRVRRRWDGKDIQKSPIDSHTNIDRASTSAPCEEASENTKSFEVSCVHPSTSTTDRSPNSSTLKGKFTKSKIPVSRVPVVVSCLDSNQSNCDARQTDMSRPLQLLHCDLNNEVQSRTAIDGNNCEVETGRYHRPLQEALRLSESRAQRALQLLRSYATHSRTETRMDSSEHNGMSTLELLNRLAEESDPDWEPPNDGEETDETISDIAETDSNYEVKIPERTWDLLERYSQESSDDDADWIPPIHCKTSNGNV